MSKTLTHYEGCYEEAPHHGCALTKLQEYRGIMQGLQASLGGRDLIISELKEEGRMQGDALAVIFGLLTDNPQWSENQDVSTLVEAAEVAANALYALDSKCPHEATVARLERWIDAKCSIAGCWKSECAALTDEIDSIEPELNHFREITGLTAIELEATIHKATGEQFEGDSLPPELPFEEMTEMATHHWDWNCR